MGARNFKLGLVIGLEAKTITLYSRKLTRPQKSYTVMEKELIKVIETLK